MFKKIAGITAGLLLAVGAVSAATPAVAADQSQQSNAIVTAAWDW
ncbi:hypothetical protein [Arthrobacter sp. VKM Ac-2550]|nr:hypothetical protein [Arthrobacter sp. VKM Ac-2550]MCW2133743.1 hypothetical protein [Arthrobacter sp. VKM Ac-2550]